MATKLGKVSRMAGEVTKKVIKPSYVDLTVPAGGASVGPPLGPVLGEYGLPINKFVEDYNNLTKDYKKGIPLPTRIHIEGKKYKIQLYEPCMKYLIRQAAGITRESPDSEEIVGKITLRHVYEIARIKSEQEDYKIRNYSMKKLCQLVLTECYKQGVQVVEDLDAEEYQHFLEVKKQEEEERKRQEEAALAEARKKVTRRMK